MSADDRGGPFRPAALRGGAGGPGVCAGAGGDQGGREAQPLDVVPSQMRTVPRAVRPCSVPQHRDLGRSATAKFYGLTGEAEARAYLAHPVLGPRYRECVAVVRAQLGAGKTLEAIFGGLDAMKFRSSVAIFGL